MSTVLKNGDTASAIIIIIIKHKEIHSFRLDNHVYHFFFRKGMNQKTHISFSEKA